ncbi:hypothetical protein [Actinobacillus porcinus]|uniref:MMPL family transporter n=1 Tax=Actinobacillus porcinus TaxID=51048 RepID=UPI002A91B8C3|nr:hypothetical protein [Actinobacillus porcinus]MDY6216496.1 hypothetical protein [Actinobacillus porcinus]
MSNVFRLGYAVLSVGIALLFGFFVKQGQWLETDLRALLPQETRWSAVQIEADRQLENQLNQQVVALVGNENPQVAFENAEKIAAYWQTSGLFSQVNSKIQPDLTALSAEIQQLKWATLPKAVRSQLLANPKAYFQHYAEQIANPFLQMNLLSLEQDWLGVGRFTLPQSQQLSKMRWNAENGFVYTEQDGVTWVLLNGQLKQADMINAEQGILTLMTESRALVAQAKTHFLSTGAALFAAVAKTQAESESTLMSVLGIGLTLALLLSVFRRFRVLWLFLPIALGMLCGVTATVALLGQVHILTLVIGTSLVGVLIDFPLHWLASSLSNPNWQAEKAMAAHQSTFLLTLGITLLGYGLLWFTDLPILKQTALFSAVALVSAILCTILFLPLLFKGANLRSVIGKENRKFDRLFEMKISSWWLLPLLMFIAVGIYRSQWKDDIRQWVSMPKEMLLEAQQIGELTGIDLGSQYFLVTAKNDDELLVETEKLSEKLTALSQPHQALSQWIMSETEQQSLMKQLQRITPQDYAVLAEIGVPTEQVAQALQAQIAPISLSTATQTLLGRGWRSLYLGKMHNGEVAAITKVSNVQNAGNLQQLADNQHIFWQDKRAYLNAAFEQTRNQAAWLKVLSFVIAGILLWRLFGLKQAAKILVIPFVAILTTIAIFGWFGLPITLFAMFGLLLVSAIGIDYTAYMYSVQEPLTAKRTAISLAALTTMISFGLLALSSTPAVASFGLSVTVGVAIAVVLTNRYGLK